MSTQNFEQLINTYHALFVWCGIAAILLVLVAVFLFFWLKIPKIFDELTGRGAKKAIAEDEYYGETAPLSQGMVRNSAPAASGGFKVIRTIIEIHTDEVIPE